MVQASTREIVSVMIRALFVLDVSVGLSALSGCSNAPNMGAAPSDGGFADALPAQCNGLVNDGPMVTPQFVATAAPAPLGGSITDGKWALTAYTVYGADGGASLPLQWATGIVTISGMTMQLVSASRSEDIDHKDQSSTEIVTSAAGTTLTLMETCPTQGSKSTEFTGTPTELRWYFSSPGIEVVETLTKRGPIAP
jgi:hypothetical protein